MKNNVVLNFLGLIFLYGMFTTPVISFLIMRKRNSLTLTWKFIVGIILAALLSGLFYTIGLIIMLLNGAVPA